MNGKRVWIHALLFATLMFPAAALAADAKPQANPGAAFAEKWIAAWNSHDVEKFLPLFTDDIFYEDVTFGEVSHNAAELRKFYLSEIEGIPDLNLKLERANIQNGHGTIEWTFSGTDTVTPGVEKLVPSAWYTVEVTVSG